MLGTLINYVYLNLALGSILTGWVQMKEKVPVGTFCNINPRTRIRFISLYCNDLSLVEILENTGVLTIPYIVYAFVISNAICSLLSLFFKLNFGKYKRTIVFFDAMNFIGAIGSVFLYLDIIYSQIMFTEENTNRFHTGFAMQIGMFVLVFITLLFSLIKLKRKNDNELVWLD